MTEDAFRRVLKTLVVKRLSTGSMVIREGEAGTGLFVVLSGEVEVSKIGPDGNPLPLATLRTGDVFGEMALIRGGATTATVVAGRPATVLFLAREYLERLVAGVPEIRQHLDNLAEERELDTQLVLSDDDPFEDDEQVLIQGCFWGSPGGLLQFQRHERNRRG